MNHPLWTAERRSDRILVLKTNYQNTRDSERWVLLVSDNHFDSPQHDREKEAAFLRKAEARDAIILCFGDLFDLMGGREDRRRSRGGIRPEHDGKGYFDRVIKDAAKFYAPVAKRFAAVSYGNHETAWTTHNDSCPLDNFATRLQAQHGCKPEVMPYSGYIVLQFHRPCGNGHTSQFAYKIAYTHGHGGNAPVTAGTVQAQRHAVTQAEANLCVQGHNHRAYLLPIGKERLSSGLDAVVEETQWHARIPGFKRSATSGNGFEFEKGLAVNNPTVTGAIWLRLAAKKNRLICQPILDTEEA